MSKSIKLAVSNRIEFDVKFSLNDGGTEKHFGMRMSAQRQPRDEQEREFSEQIKIVEFLDARGLQMLAWIGKPALVGENDEPVPAGPEALSVLYDLVVGMVNLVYASYQQANGVKGRSGN